jgi:hypothetical protein
MGYFRFLTTYLTSRAHCTATFHRHHGQQTENIILPYLHTVHVGTVRRVQYVSVCCPWCQWFPETEINLENTADLVGKSRENVENRGKMEKTLIKTVYFFKLDAKVRLLYKTLLVYKKST